MTARKAKHPVVTTPAPGAHLVASPGHRPAPPPHLGETGRALWLRLLTDFEMSDSASLVTLSEACSALDLLEAAHAQLRKDGATFRDRWNQPRSHPAAMVVRDSRAGLLACLRALGCSQAGLVPEAKED